MEASEAATYAASLQLARDEQYFYTRWMHYRTTGRIWQRAQHHPEVCQALDDVMAGVCPRVIFNMPPRYSKTNLVQKFVSRALGKFPDSQFIYTSYSAELAEGNSWETRNLIEHPAYTELYPDVKLRADSKARHLWHTTRGGQVYAAGAGGTITGKGAGLKREGFGGAVIIDDPHKPDEALSDVMRAAVIRWYQNTIVNRCNSAHTPIIVIMQRLHEEDLSGWLLKGGSGEEWRHICLPALQEDGSALWPEMHSAETLLQMQDAMPYVFAGQYQQRPAPAEGGFFKPMRMPIVTAIPFGTKFVRGWDFAASETLGSAFTAGSKLGKMPDGRYIIVDVRRFRGMPDDVASGLVNTAQSDGKSCDVDIPQDPGQAGKAQVAHFTRLLDGFPVYSSPESGDKVQRAQPFASQVNVGSVLMLKGEWNDALVQEMAVFPNGKYKDQVDSLSRAYTRLSNGGQWVLGTLPR
ncbi:MAG: phage terminase large subunit [Patescibacteria group bacterium]|nr:phage terminase large subunit [Patescibacteria group bacterium]